MNGERLVYLSGEFVPESQAAISIFDWGIMYGHLVFEVTRTFAHKPFRLRPHLERLYASMKYVEIDPGMTIEEMEVATNETIERNKVHLEPQDDFIVTHNVSNGPQPQYASAFSSVRPTVVINVWSVGTAIPPERYGFYDHGVDAVITSQRSVPARLMDPKVKSRSRLYYRMAEIEAQRRTPGGWAVLTDEDGFITEGTGSNFMIVSDGELISPEPRNILLGVTRAAVIDLALELDIPFRETNIGTYEAVNANEAFFCSTPFVIMAVARVNGHSLADGAPGPVTAKLMEAFKDHVGVDFVEQGLRYAAAADESRRAAVA